MDNWNREVASNFGLDGEYVDEVAKSVAKATAVDLCYTGALERLRGDKIVKYCMISRVAEGGGTSYVGS